MQPLAVSLGDPAGVGPELLVEAWLHRNEASLPPFFAAGGASILTAAAQARGVNVPVTPIADPTEASAHFDSGLPVLGTKDGDYHPGNPDQAGAAFALASLTAATQLAVSGKAGAVVTGPIAKSLLADVGFVHPGQTEFVAEACGVAEDDAVMLLAGPNLKTVPLTVHVALTQVPLLITEDLICRRTRILANALRNDFGITQPRIAVAALNPHAGESGRMGDEEIDIIAPAIAKLRAEGIDATGPHPADALFAPHARGTYDAAVCMYHDQALIPMKALDFDEGVNMTLGLPIVRTSPDHGTAFALAGKRLANPGATIAAIRLAGECASRRAKI